MRTKNKIILFAMMLSVPIVPAGCQNAEKSVKVNPVTEINERHANAYGNFDLPRKIGSVENVGLELPKISPDGKMMVYFRSDCESLSTMTLLGSPLPSDTPADKSLTIWVRPVQGSSAGRMISTQRWCHSPVWSPNSRAIVYVVNEPPVSWIEHVDLESGTRTAMGQKGMINCLPRFDSDGQTILFCSAEKVNGPFRIYRQALDQKEPTAISPQGMDCLLPVLRQKDGRVICASSSDEQLRWITADSQGTSLLVDHCGNFDKPAVLATWAGISEPVSPDRQSILFYDSIQNRICIYHRDEKFVRNHRSDSIAACWLDDRAIALATAERVFLVSTQTGMSLELFNGAWIPGRYLTGERKLILFGRENARRFSIFEVQFRNRDSKSGENKRGVKS
jgi:hypothetical protein